MTQSPIVAIRFDTEDIDYFLSTIVASLNARDVKTRGAIQTRGPMSSECHCADMDVTTLGSGRVFRISQPLGNGSGGCRLNPGALADCTAFLLDEISQNTDLLILNRFGRGESEGREFRDLIASALATGIPVLTAVRPTYFDAWVAYMAGEPAYLPLSHKAVLNWFSDVSGHPRDLVSVTDAIPLTQSADANFTS